MLGPCRFAVSVLIGGFIPLAAWIYLNEHQDVNFSLSWSPYHKCPQWRNRLAHGTYMSVLIRLSNAGVVSSSLTWGITILKHICTITNFFTHPSLAKKRENFSNSNTRILEIYVT